MRGNGRGGACGGCKLLRRKCVKGACVFAEYFEADEQGTTEFAAVHRVFGASNATKLLQRLPADKRLDAVVSLSYEALSRVTDPVYGCVSHIFALQQQVINLQAELAYVKARLLTMQRHPPPPSNPLSTAITTTLPPSKLVSSDSNSPSLHFDETSLETSRYINNDNVLSGEQLTVNDDDLEILARELLTKYLPGVKIRPSTSC